MTHKATSMVLNPDPIHVPEHWVIRIREIFDQDSVEEINGNIPVCIFNVPKTLMSSNPEAYTPQQIALGPYHHWCPELYQMERYKIAAAKKTQKQLQGFEFEFLIDKITELEPKIRACYHKFLDLDGETLAWLMAIDASFLLEFLKIYVNIDDSKRFAACCMSRLVDAQGRKLTQDMILRDLLMLENQIPVFLLRQILELQSSSQDDLDQDQLSLMLMKLCQKLSPLKVRENLTVPQVAESSHLLDLLYNVMVPPKFDEPQEVLKEITDDHHETDQSSQPGCFPPRIPLEVFDKLLKKITSSLNLRPARILSKCLRPIVFLLNMPWKTISRLPGISISAQILADEIMIPSVSELYNAGVRFRPASGDITSVRFDDKTLTFYLPVVSLDVNTEVIMRNLVAYEAWVAPGPLALTRYTELMNGIIDTAEDVKLLRKSNIMILNGLKNDDDEVAKLWNGMSKSIRVTRVPFLDRTIDDVDKYYNSLWKVKAKKFMARNVYKSWKILTLLAAILLLLLMALQSFCSIYSCSSGFRIKYIAN